MPETIALNGLFLDYPGSGTWTYTRNLAHALPAVDPDRQYLLWTRRAGLESLADGLLQRRAPSPFPPQPSYGRLASWWERMDKLCWETVAWPWAARRANLLHSLYFAAPPVKPAPLVVTVHDMIPVRLPGYVRHRSAGWYARLMKRTSRAANAIITVSEHSRQEIAAELNYPVDRIFVTPEAPDPSLAPDTTASGRTRVTERYNLPQRYVLYLGGSERRKNVEMLVRAWAGAAVRDASLVIVGRYPTAPDAVFPDVPGLVARLNLAKRCALVPFVATEDLAAVYSGALAFCFPSLYEGFGLPPLEAMACGTAVLCSDASSLPEVAGGGAEMLNPHDEQAWAKALERVVADDEWRRELVARGGCHVQQFSWATTAVRTAQVYSRVLEGSCAS